MSQQVHRITSPVYRVLHKVSQDPNEEDSLQHALFSALRFPENLIPSKARSSDLFAQENQPARIRFARLNRLNLELKLQPLSIALLTHWDELLTRKSTYPKLTLIERERTPIKSAVHSDTRHKIILDHHSTNHCYLNLKCSWETGYRLKV